jgi:hypothetical protein
MSDPASTALPGVPAGSFCAELIIQDEMLSDFAHP